MGDLQPWHIIVILAVLVVLFGSRKLPGAARSIGQSLRIFKSEMKQSHKESEEAESAQFQQVPPAVAPPAPVTPTPTANITAEPLPTQQSTPTA
jgi:sec-independent protein translocase protein TatA